MDLLNLITPLATQVWEHAKPVEFAQGLLQAGIIWQLVKKSMKEELAQIRKTISDGFASGETRFGNLENRVSKLETKP